MKFIEDDAGNSNEDGNYGDEGCEVQIRCCSELAPKQIVSSVGLKCNEGKHSYECCAAAID